MEENRIGFGPRLGAYLIDAVFLAGLGYILAAIAEPALEGFINYDKFTDQQLDAMSLKPIIWTLSVIWPIAVMFVSLPYSLIEGIFAQSPGKMLVKIIIRNQDNTPAPISKLLLRFLLKNLNNFVALFGIFLLSKTIDTFASLLGLVITIGCFFVLGQARLAFHDMLAKTAVYKSVTEESPEA